MQGIEYYRGDDPAFVLPALELFGCEQTIRFFQSIGIEPKEKNGYVYPRSMQGFRAGSTFVRTSQTEGKNRIGMWNPADLTEKGSYEICTKMAILCKNLHFSDRRKSTAKHTEVTEADSYI